MAQTSMTLMITLALANLTVCAHADAFLKKPQRLSERVSEEDIRTSLLSEVEASVGEGKAQKRVPEIEAALRPIIAALPKNEHGNLGHSAVRYALHRLFVLRHGWVVSGLNNDGKSNETSSPAGVLKDQVPAYIESMFEERLAGKGFGLKEVAVLAATIEHLIHNEAVSRLGTAFNLLELPVTGSFNDDEAREIVDTYMMVYILGSYMDDMTVTRVRKLHTEMPEILLSWHETQIFAHDIWKKLSAGAKTHDFASLAKVVEAIAEDYGSFQNFECVDLKQKLMNMEFRGTGRVPLSEFYKPALGGVFTFQESAAYLRANGQLDETDVNSPSVIIPNYVTGLGNCISTSGFYSICCKDECAGLLGQLEMSIGAHEAKPADIASIIASVNSSTVPVPKVSSALRQRLDDIAATHGGNVQLHGRLFAQWMHHVYPRECPYPHLSNSIDAMTPEEWLDNTEEDSTATKEDMLQHVEQSRNATYSKEMEHMPMEDLLPWSHEEELFIVRSPVTADSTKSTSGWMRNAMLFAALGSMVFGLMQKMHARPGFPGDKGGSEKYFV